MASTTDPLSERGHPLELAHLLAAVGSVPEAGAAATQALDLYRSEGNQTGAGNRSDTKPPCTCAKGPSMVDSYVTYAAFKSGDLELSVNIDGLPSGQPIEIDGVVTQDNGFIALFKSAQNVAAAGSELLVTITPDKEPDPSADLIVNIRVVVNTRVVQAWPNTLIPTAPTPPATSAWTIGALTRVAYIIARSLFTIALKLDHYFKK